jgi:hypothetical protein
LSVLVSWLRGRLVHASATPSITAAVAVNIAVLVATMAVLARSVDLSGAQIGSIALSLSLVAETAALGLAVRHASRATGSAPAPAPAVP